MIRFSMIKVHVIKEFSKHSRKYFRRHLLKSSKAFKEIRTGSIFYDMRSTNFKKAENVESCHRMAVPSTRPILSENSE